MKLKDFLGDRLAYLVVYFASTLLVILIMYLATIIEKNGLSGANAAYAFLVSGVLMAIFLGYDYLRKRAFYWQLNSMLDMKADLGNLLSINNAASREQQIFADVLKKAYRTYGDNIGKYEELHKQYQYFVSQWVHQMKTPVSVINLILQDKNDEESRSVFDSIAEENEKLSHGLEMMLYNARLNEFNLDFNVESLNIIPVLRKIINNNKKSLIRHYIFPKIIADEAVIVETDTKWISFVINQIFINAIKYSKDVYREKKSIVFEVTEKDNCVILRIKDEGIGIPREDLGRVFDANFTGKNGRKTAESTGMGMYLSKRICEELGHDLLVESEEGLGTTFSLVFYCGKNIFRI